MAHLEKPTLGASCLGTLKGGWIGFARAMGWMLTTHSALIRAFAFQQLFVWARNLGVQTLCLRISVHLLHPKWSRT